MNFCNIDFDILNRKQIFDLDLSDGLKCIATANAQFIVLANNDKRFMSYLNKNHVTFDGEVPYKIARLTSKNREIEKISGSDLIYDFCNYSVEKGYSVFFLGGAKSSIDGAVKNLRKEYGIRVGGYSPSFEEYPFSDSFMQDCKDRLKEFGPDVLFVGFGAPKQEFFIEDMQDFLTEIGVKFVVGSGGTVDFVSKRLKRAPKWIQKCGLEGVYRLVQEPSKKRLLRLLYSFKFFKYLW